jgi:hypothetical protein
MVVKTFEDEQEAHEWLQQDEQQCWSKHYLNPSFEGDKSYYRCNKVKSRGPQCASRICLQYNATDNRVLLHQTDAQHNHDDILAVSAPQGINVTTKALIRRLYARGVTKPTAIHHQIEEAMASDPALKMPTETQLYNFLNSVRNGGLKGPFTFAELYEWCETHSPVPDPEQSDEPFVVNYQINVDDDADDDHERLFPLNDEGIQSVPINQSSFRILISSRRLLSILSSTQVIQADSSLCGKASQSR